MDATVYLNSVYFESNYFSCYNNINCDNTHIPPELSVLISVFKAICPICHGTHTTIRTSKRMAVGYQVIYCDCLDENGLTQFKINYTVT